MELPVNKDLAGWQVEIWYELTVPASDGPGTKCGGYFKNRSLADVKAKARGWWGDDAIVTEVLVLTKPGAKEGLLIGSEELVHLINEEEEEREAVRRVAARLDPRERALLNL